MIPLSLAEIASVVGGAVHGDAATMVTAPAAMDARQVEAHGLFVAFAGVKVDGHDFADQAAQAGAAAVLGTRATSLPTVVVQDATVALQALAVHVVRRLRVGLTVIGVTGSQGKTSTKDLLTAAFSAAGPTTSTAGNFNNQLGVPLTMLRADADTRYLVVEMGARHIGDIAFLTGLVAPDVSVVLNVGHAHIGEFGSRENIARGKGELVEGLAPGGTAVLNMDDQRVLAMRSLTDGPVLTYGAAEDADVRVVDLALDRLGRPTFTLAAGDVSVVVALPLIGAHQAHNAAAAAAAGLAAGIPLEDSAAAMSAVTLTKWRMELRELASGATLINDSYNASPGSTRASLDALESIEAERHIAVLGEILELGESSEAEHRGVGEYAATKADIVIAVGENVRPAALGAGDRGVALADRAAAVDWLRENLGAGDVVLVKGSRGAHMDEVAAALP
jgi:UDP-N-acetylmuramoyl-tripeptide--D-alanyl-D-alanine ligase